MYKITFIVRNYVNDTAEYETIQETYEAIKDCAYDINSDTDMLDSFYDAYMDKVAVDLIELKDNGKIVIPFENDEHDYGAMIVERV